MDEQERFVNAVASVARFAVISCGLEDFATKVIRHVRRGLPFTRTQLANIKAECVRDTKNVDVSGFPIEREAELLRQAFDDLEKFIDSAISKGWARRQFVTSDTYPKSAIYILMARLHQ